MKVIDLLNKIANDEEVPKKIKWNNLAKDYQILIYDEEEQEYVYENDKNQFCDFPNHHLNDEIEIIEDTPKENKKIEKLTDQDLDPNWLNVSGVIFRNKINEIIDKINGE